MADIWHGIMCGKAQSNYFLCAFPSLLIVCVEFKKHSILSKPTSIRDMFQLTILGWHKMQFALIDKMLRFYLQPRISDNYYGDLKDITVPTLTTQHSNKVSQFHKTLKNATGKKLLKLQVNFKNNTQIS